MIDDLESIAKIGLYAALLIIVGSHVTRWLLHVTAGEPGAVAPQSERRTSRLGIAAGVALLLCLMFRLCAHTAAVFGVVGTLPSWADVWLIAFDSRWGGSWRIQVIAAMVSLLVSAWAMRRSGAGPPMAAALASVALVCTFPLTGHASGQPVLAAIDILHLAGGGAWLGTLAVLILVKPQNSIFERFSPLALSGAAIAVSTGLVMAWLYLGSIENIWTTSYGRLLAAKVTLLCAVAACGYVNWRRAQAHQLPSAARLELTLALAVIVITAFLTETAHP